MGLSKKKQPALIECKALQLFSDETAVPQAIATQWQFGDWQSLQNMTFQQLEQQDARAQMALMVAVAHFQCGVTNKGIEFLNHAKLWGCSPQLIRKVLASGVYNTIGRAALLVDQYTLAQKSFFYSLTLGMPDADDRLLTPIRMAHQAMQLGIPLVKVQKWNLIMPVDEQRQDENVLEPIIAGQQTEVPSHSQLLERLMGHLDYFARKLDRAGRETEIDGVKVFYEQDPFLSGKIAMGMAYWVTQFPSGSSITVNRCHQFKSIMELIRDDTAESWGIYFYLKAIHKINCAGLLQTCFPGDIIENLRLKLDWRSFVEKETFRLINKANNFYGIAYSIAYIRYQLGWEDEKPAEQLFQNLIDHYQLNIGQFGFADETEGKGRYDRYSILLIAEIAHHFRESGLPLTNKMKAWLRKSAEVVLLSLNKDGFGLQYGRSIGAYGDTAFLEVLSAAAWFGLLNDKELKGAIYFCKLVTIRFLNFWFDDDIKSVNLWNEGRSTESYRGKHRILGENISLLHQHVYTQEILKMVSEKNKTQFNQKEYIDWLSTIPSNSFIKFFEKKELCYGLLIVRDGRRVFHLPLVNGDSYHLKNTYYPIPYCESLIKGIPGAIFPQLIPEIVESNIGKYRPIVFFSGIKKEYSSSGSLVFSYLTQYLDDASTKCPKKNDGITVRTTYTFASGKISRRDVVEIRREHSSIKINTEFASLSTIQELNESGAKFDGIVLKEFRFIGYKIIGSSKEIERFGTPEGPIQEIIYGEKTLEANDVLVTIGWDLAYRNE